MPLPLFLLGLLGAGATRLAEYASRIGFDDDLTQSEYDFTYRIFPSDLGMEDNDHYMIININVPTILGATAGGITSSDSVLSGERSKVDVLRFGPEGSALRGERTALQRGTRRIKESIALHMPNGGLVYTEDNLYEPVSMTAIAGSTIGSIAAGALNSIASAVTGEKSTFGTTVVDGIGNVIKTGSKVTGNPINPQVEVIFATRPMREWMFEVLLAPRSEEESETVQEIIRTMRLYAAPEITGLGFVFIPPAEFDITFYRDGQESQHLPRINTCVLKRFEVDYAPAEGKYTTFSNGAPVAVRMSMNFQEVEILHKKRVAQGF